MVSSRTHALQPCSTPNTVFMVNLPTRGRTNWPFWEFVILETAALSAAAICTILTESKELVGPRLHFYHEVYIVSLAGYTLSRGGGSVWVVKGALMPVHHPCQCAGILDSSSSPWFTFLVWSATAIVLGSPPQGGQGPSWWVDPMFA